MYFLTPRFYTRSYPYRGVRRSMVCRPRPAPCIHYRTVLSVEPILPVLRAEAPQMGSCVYTGIGNLLLWNLVLRNNVE